MSFSKFCLSSGILFPLATMGVLRLFIPSSPQYNETLLSWLVVSALRLEFSNLLLLAGLFSIVSG